MGVEIVTALHHASKPCPSITNWVKETSLKREFLKKFFAVTRENVLEGFLEGQEFLVRR